VFILLWTVSAVCCFAYLAGSTRMTIGAETKRINAMNDTTIGPVETEEEILTYEASDEELETAAGTGKELASWTAFCSGISCPG
jgi:hypothetical protein